MSRYAVQVIHHHVTDAQWTRKFRFKWRAKAYIAALHEHPIGTVSTMLYRTQRAPKR